jgi:hypothetical protein
MHEMSDVSLFKTIKNIINPTPKPHLMHEMSDVSLFKTIKNIMWNIVCWMNSSKEIRKGK